MFSKRTNQWNVPYNVYNPVAEKRRDMENDAAIYKRWRKEQEQKKSEKTKDCSWQTPISMVYLKHNKQRTF